jgi:diketogulonate reductase-like aldo/keto reductase
MTWGQVSDALAVILEQWPETRYLTHSILQQNTLEEGVTQLNVAFDELGINFIDTAEMYPIPVKPETQGKTDLTIAAWLKTRKREDVIVASKVAGFEILMYGKMQKYCRPRKEENDVMPIIFCQMC